MSASSQNQKGSHLCQGARRSRDLEGCHGWDACDAGAGDEPAENIGPTGVDVVLVRQRLVAHQAVHDDKLKAEPNNRDGGTQNVN